jgi:ABC-type uncharacterized transport system permease subunit
MVFLGLFNTGKTDAGTLTFGFNPTLFGDMLFYATPLIMTGLSVAVSQKTGLFNIGAPGQYLMGTTASLMIALSIPTSSVPPVVVWLLAFLGGMLAGALWGAIPGLLKAFLNINEVLACIMTNWIAANLVTWAFDGSAFRNLTESTKSSYIYKTSFNGVATPKLGLDKLFPGSQVNAGILVAIVLAILMYILTGGDKQYVFVLQGNISNCTFHDTCQVDGYHFQCAVFSHTVHYSVGRKGFFGDTLAVFHKRFYTVYLLTQLVHSRTEHGTLYLYHVLIAVQYRVNQYRVAVGHLK